MASHECGRCGKRQKIDALIFSRFSRNHYCADLDACARRAKRTHRPTIRSFADLTKGR